MPDAIPHRLRGEMTDEVHTVLAKMFVPQIQLVLDFDGTLDADRLAVALRRVLDAEPVLGCHYVPRWIWPYYERISDAELDRVPLLRVVDDGDREAISQGFLGEEMPLYEGPQLRALLHRGEGGDRVLLKVHHRPADAGGVKEVGYRLAEVYRALGDDPDHRPAPRVGARSLHQVIRRFLPWRLPEIIWRAVVELWPFVLRTGELRYPTAAWEGEPPRFALRDLDVDQVRRMNDLGRPRSATLNDQLVAAMLRAVAAQRDWNGEGSLRVVSTADLRRHLDGERTGGLCNLSGFILIYAGRELGERFEDTLDHVCRATRAVKGPTVGLSYDTLGVLLFWWVPAGVFRATWGAMLQTDVDSGRMPFLVTNMGPIDDGALDRFGPSVRHAFLVCPAICQGMLGLGISGYRGTLTLSVGAGESAIPLQTLQDLLARAQAELPG